MLAIMLLVFARTFARTARNCFHKKPNDTKCESKILRFIKACVVPIEPYFTPHLKAIG